LEKYQAWDCKTEKLLNSYGISTIQNAFETGKIELENILGKWGADLWEKITRPCIFSKVQPYHEAKSISSEKYI
jgi:nucleotidyltransferase/DNA polymerase involved in DNA repair